MCGFIKYMRSEEAEFLLAYPNANHLFCVMANRARRTDHPMNGLKAGQCFLGDFAAIGLTERQYRTAKGQLEKWSLATFKGTNKGTVATIVNSKVYDINEKDADRQATDKRQASDRQATTNKECKNGRMEEGKNNTANGSPLDFSVLGMSDDQIQEVIRIKKKNAKNAKSAKLSQRMVNGLAKQFHLAASEYGFTFDELLTTWENRGWTSFEADWVKPKANRSKQSQTSNQAEIQAWLEEESNRAAR